MIDSTFNKFEIFREIVIGGLSKEKLLKQLSENGIQFNKYATTLFDHHQFLPAAEVEKVKLVKVSLADLDLNDSCSTEEFECRAFELGLKSCPLYLAAFLRLQYIDQPVGPYLTIASKKPENDDNYPNGFYIRNFDNTLWLRGYKADSFAGWPEKNEFIFINGSPSIKAVKRKVLEDYEIAYPNPIRLSVGDKVQITKRETNPDWLGWVFCIDKNGVSGWVSEKYLNIDGPSANVLRNYDATELAVKAGEKVYCLVEEFGWSWVRNERNHEGWVPIKNLGGPE